MKQAMRPIDGHVHRVVLSLLLGLALLLGTPGSSRAQQNKKNKNNAEPDQTSPTAMMNDQQQVDYVISSMLGAWQVGDADKLHESYADDATFVSGVWGPPIVGWANYAPVYLQQRGRMQHVRLERSNTLSKVVGNFAWACYQWDFSATIDGVLAGSQGQTTLILEKRNAHWLIVENHTSLIQSKTAGPTGPGSAPLPTQPPSKPASP
jgi:ketosteroid isomerase-like protein